MGTKLIFGLAAAYVVGAAAWVLSAGFVKVELLNVACDPTRELWHDVNEAFAAHYERETGVRPAIRQSHGGSGSQARAVIDGLQGDVVSLALFTDTDAIRKAKLIDAGWEDRLPNRSLPYVSTIVMVVRKGNPKNVRDWTDLGRDDVQVITPSPKTSGNGKWSFLALWGSAAWAGGSEPDARAFVTKVYKNVKVLDAAARGATMSFTQKKQGDVHLTWENEAHLEVKEAAQAAKDKNDPSLELEIVYPKLSVLAEPHVAVLDENVRRRGTKLVAEAYLNFLYTDEAQELIAKNYHRPTNTAVFARHRDLFPDLDLRRATTLVPSGRWDGVQTKFFAEGAIFDQVYGSGRK